MCSHELQNNDPDIRESAVSLTGPDRAVGPRVHLAFLRIIPSSNLLTTALPLLYHASDLTISYLTVSRILNLIKHERAEPTVTRARPHTTQTLLPQLHKIQRSVCLVFFFYDILQGSTSSYLPLLIFPDPFPCAACVISQFTTWPIYLVFQTYDNTVV